MDKLLINYERRIPTNLEEAMEELDRRIMITAATNLGQVNARVLMRQLLEDFEKGLLAREKGMIIKSS